MKPNSWNLNPLQDGSVKSRKKKKEKKEKKKKEKKKKAKKEKKTAAEAGDGSSDSSGVCLTWGLIHCLFFSVLSLIRLNDLSYCFTS